MKATRITLLALSLAATPAIASDLDLSLTNDSVKGQANFFNASNELQMGVGYAYHEGGRDILNLDFHAQGRTAIGNLPTTAGIGIRGYAWEDDNLDGGAGALGGFATLNIPRAPGLSFTGSLHYAPSIMSFGDSDDLTSLELRGSYRLIRNGELFVGYRYLNTDFDGPIRGDLNLDEGVMAGMKIFF
ncbi:MULTISPECIES: YfaZ family outer membrane protein [Marinobacter]|uniref:YfaZ family outer membrane protein n=1 Tax=Marinobacter suaedae TaxID=3057675 RepID=A0ABT8VWI5_9GAMM|nr:MULTISPECIES: YfaZ family outer membrane protein [unclassified Marinobacter]MBZ2168449.1 YfaZ family protein [Marinobacter sp. F4216]MDO3720347.1 YfaZ family outer membrane protein [Marinobacter sp. chi1]